MSQNNFTQFIFLRNDVSSGVASAIANAVLMDFGIITEDDKDMVVDRTKIERHIMFIIKQ